MRRRLPGGATVRLPWGALPMGASLAYRLGDAVVTPGAAGGKPVIPGGHRKVSSHPAGQFGSAHCPRSGQTASGRACSPLLAAEGRQPLSYFPDWSKRLKAAFRPLTVSSPSRNSFLGSSPRRMRKLAGENPIRPCFHAFGHLGQEHGSQTRRAAGTDPPATCERATTRAYLAKPARSKSGFLSAE
jgi:hypothetical protein